MEQQRNWCGAQQKWNWKKQETKTDSESKTTYGNAMRKCKLIFGPLFVISFQLILDIELLDIQRHDFRIHPSTWPH